MSPGSRLLRVVIDTNVLFSAAALPKDSPPSRVLSPLGAFHGIEILTPMEFIDKYFPDR